MAGGRSSKTKGTRVERELVKKLEKDGIPAWRVPMSGAIGGSLNSDIKIGPDREWDCEVKARKGGGGFVQIERWLGNNQCLFLKRDFQDPLVVVEWDVFVDLFKSPLECKKGDLLGAKKPGDDT